MKKENYNEISQRLETTSTEHVKETNEEATVHGYKILNVGPYNETFPDLIGLIWDKRGSRRGCLQKFAPGRSQGLVFAFWKVKS